MIFNNSITATGTAVVYAAVAALSNNRIYGSAIGVSTNVSDPATLFGAVAGSTPNIITGNAIGISLANAQVIDQQVTANTIGLSGSGIIGGSAPSDLNLITYNGTGIANFTGLVEFNRIEDNGTGIAATNGLNIYSNQLVANTSYGILISGVGDLQIAGNTIISYIGDAIHLANSAHNVDVVSNIIWTDTGYGIYVDNNSQLGFWSDYNTLFAAGTGKIVYWTKSFVDILDWQDDVDQFDLHSVGTTVVNPNWAEPHFGVDAYGFLITRPEVAGQKPTDPTADAGDPAGSFIGFNGTANLIANGNFESGLGGWTVTAGGSTTSTALTPWLSTAAFEFGGASNAVAQQTINLLTAGYTSTQLDSGSLQVAFGGEVALLSSAVRAQISILFLDGGGNTIGNAIVVPAGTSVGSWMRVLDTVYVPAGARSVEYIFGVSKSDNSNGALLDDAFLGVIAQGQGVDQGVRTSPDNLHDDPTLGRITLTSPVLYVNWQDTVPNFITWNDYGAAAGQQVSIQLWQQSANGPQLLSTIAASTPDTGEYAWSPSQSGIAPGTHGLLIKIASVANPSIYDMSTEGFTVPEAGSAYYVAATGSNRNDGMSAASALPSPVNLFRAYNIEAGAVVNIAAGSYPLIVPLQLSGTTNYGFGLDTGFTIDGASGGGTILFPANPDIIPAALISITGSSFVSINNLTLQGGVTSLLVNGGSDNFSASYLTSNGASGTSFNITTNSPTGTLDHLTSIGAGGDGLIFDGSIGTISNFTATGDQYGILAGDNVATSIGEMLNSTFTNNSSYGVYLTLSGASLIEGNTFSGNYFGARLIGSGIVFGDSNLADGFGNIITGSTYEALITQGVTVVGNTLSKNTGRYEAADVYGGSFSYNLVFGNTDGVQINSSVSVIGNRIFDNFGNGSGSGIGLILNSDNITVSQNTIYSNNIGIQVYGSGQTIKNNVIFADTYAGVQLESATNVTIANNTVYEPAAGTTVDPVNPNWGVGAIVLDGSSTAATLSSNIIVALSGVAVQVSNASQAGFVSDYNLFQTGSGGRIGTWLGLTQTSLTQWITATGRDTHSQFADPGFVSPTGGTGQLGYYSPTINGNADDFHVESLQASDHGGSLSVIVGANGLPQMATGVYTADAVSSPAIAAGNPATPIGAEPSPNGGIVEIGAYGGTSELSLTPAAFLTITGPAGGATLTQGATVPITWNTFNVSGNVNISVSADGGTTFTTLASGVANSGSYAWTINPAAFAPGTTYVVEVASASNPTIYGISASPFTVAAPVHVYYVNASATGGQYTTAGGSDFNSGQSAASPMATLGALLAKYTLGAGDIVYVDAGTYNLTNNIVFGAADSGTGTLPSQTITIQGPTQPGLSAIFNRQGTTTGFYDFEFKGASDVTLANLTIVGANIGVALDDNAKSIGITVENSTITNNSVNLYDGIGDNNFTVIGSTISALGSTAAVVTGAISGSTLTVTGVTSGTIGVGDFIVGPGVTQYTTVSIPNTGSGGAGTYYLSNSQALNNFAITASILGTTLTVKSASGTLAVGDVIIGGGVAANTFITALGPDGSGTYTVSVSQTVASINSPYALTAAIPETLTLLSPTTTAYNVEVNQASNPLITNDSFAVNPGSSGSNYGVYFTQVANGTVANSSFDGTHAYAPVLIEVVNSTNLLINNVTTANSTYYGIYASGTTGLIENSTINAIGATFGLQISGPNNAGMLLAEGNTIYGEIAGNSGGGALNVEGYAEALNNTVYNSNIGITVSGPGSLAEGNVVYNDTIGAGVGIEVEGSGTALGNTVYGSTYGILDDGPSNFIENNTLYGNTTGIQIGQYTNSANHLVVNNTIVQSGGVALNLYSSSATNTTFEDNILSLSDNAIGIVAPQSAQVGFITDYNLYDLHSGATVATWSGQSIATLTGFKTEVAQEENGIAADPQFVNAAADNFNVQNTSPAIDRGNPAMQYLFEPVGVATGDGDRIDIGAQGGTALANPSASQLIQLLGSTGGQAYQVGQSATIDFRSAGLTALDPVVSINAGGGAVAGSPSWNAWQADEFATVAGNQYTNTTTVNANGLNVPQSVLQDYMLFNASGTGGSGKFVVPVSDGTYQVTLIFEDPYSYGIGQRVFNILANGVTEVSSYDVYKAAGAANKATEVTFDVSASGGTGLTLALQSVTNVAILSGIQISRVNPSPTTWTANAEISYDGGTTWTTIATGLPLDTFGAGSFSFTPTQATTNGLLQIIATNGQQSVSDISQGTFSVAPAGSNFYVSATGSDSNSGKSPSSPMASLAALLNIYTLQPGDTIYVGAGTYTLPSAIVLGASDSGSPGNPIQIIGQGPTTIFKSASNVSTSSVFQFSGAHDVTIENIGNLRRRRRHQHYCPIPGPAIFRCRGSIFPASPARASRSAPMPPISPLPALRSTIRCRSAATTASISTPR